MQAVYRTCRTTFVLKSTFTFSFSIFSYVRYVTASEKLFCSCLYFFLYTRFNLLSDTKLVPRYTRSSVNNSDFKLQWPPVRRFRALCHVSVVVGSHWLLVNIAIFPKGKMVLSVHYSRMYASRFWRGWDCAWTLRRPNIARILRCDRWYGRAMSFRTYWYTV